MNTVVIYRLEWEDAGGRVLFLEDSFTGPVATARARSPYGTHLGSYPVSARVGTPTAVAVPDDWRLDHTAAVVQLVRAEGEGVSRLTAQCVRGLAERGSAGFRLAGG